MPLLFLSHVLYSTLMMFATVFVYFYFKELLHLSIKLYALKIFKLNFPKQKANKCI